VRGAADGRVDRQPSTRRQTLRVTLFLAVVAVQAGVPAVMLTQSIRDPETRGYSRQHHLGWQMYEGSTLDVRYLARLADGSMRRIDAPKEVGTFWGHVDYGSGAPKRLCDADPRRVTVTRYAGIRGLTPMTEASFRCG
jgi:hypothetical protein